MIFSIFVKDNRIRKVEEKPGYENDLFNLLGSNGEGIYLEIKRYLICHNGLIDSILLPFLHGEITSEGDKNGHFFFIEASTIGKSIDLANAIITQ
jgi:hypothetical protein